ncbi:MAG: hypothetical protein LIO99_13550 [Clostridiales bacterium]|nr:hypothetical protein [Clostridiales bacterium]MCC8107001.1 hypothetical protein [Clostridiales bacterium]
MSQELRDEFAKFVKKHYSHTLMFKEGDDSDIFEKIFGRSFLKLRNTFPNEECFEVNYPENNTRLKVMINPEFAFDYADDLCMDLAA